MVVEDFEEEMVSTTTTTDTVVISEKMLWPEWRYRLRLYVSLDGVTGFAEAELFMNQPPRGGECSIGKNTYGKYNSFVRFRGTRVKIDQVVATGVNNVVLHPVNSIVNNVVEPC